MAKLLLLSVLGLVMLSLSQASVLLSPDQNSVSQNSDKKGTDWGQLDSWDNKGDNSFTDVVEVFVEDSVDDINDDNAIENELTQEEKKVGEHVEFPLNDMDNDELVLYLNLEDQILLGQADEHVAFKLLKEKRSLYTKGGKNLRRKRIAPLIGRAVFAAGRALLSRFARSGATRSGSRVTRHYNGRGNYGDAVRDFNRLRPDNVRSFNGRISGRTGTMGNHRVTVRDGSSGNSRPTLEIRSHNGELVRKFRYNNP